MKTAKMIQSVYFQLIFGTDDLRLNRKKLCSFSEFTSKVDDADFIQKCDSKLADFSKFQLLSTTNFFQLDADGDEVNTLSINFI